MKELKVKGTFSTLILAILFGVTPALCSVTYAMGSNAITLTFYRNIMVVPVLLIAMLALKIPLKLTKEELFWMLVVGVGFRASTTLMLYASYDYTGIGMATTLHFLYPVFTAVIAKLFFKEKFGVPKCVALLMATAGIVLSNFSAEGYGMTGVILAAVSGLTYAIYMTLMERTCLKEIHPFKVACYMGLFNALAMVAIDLPFHLPFGPIHYALPPLALFYTFLVSMSTSFLAVVLLQIGISSLGAGTAAIFSMLEPVTCIFSGCLLLGEIMDSGKILSCGLVLAAVLIIIVVDKKRSSQLQVNE